MRQSKKASLVETVSSTAFGFGIAWLANWLVLPMFGFRASASESFLIAVVFTFISLVRSYVFRRAFEALRVNGMLP